MELETEGVTGEDVGILFSSSVLHDSLLKENRHFMQPSQALINKTPLGGCLTSILCKSN